MKIKFTVTEITTDVSEDLKVLINREADLMSRGRALYTLSGLRERITSLFLKYVVNEGANPAMKLLTSTSSAPVK